MIRILLACAICIFILASFGGEALSADNRPVIYFFWGDGCPHCAKEETFLKQLQLKYPQVAIRSFEVWSNPENAKFFSDLAGAYGLQPKGVPMTIIGDFEPISGYRSDEVTGRIIEERINFCIEKSCIDPLDKLKKKAGAEHAAEEGRQDIPQVKEPSGQARLPDRQAPQELKRKAPLPEEKVSPAVKETKEQKVSEKGPAAAKETPARPGVAGIVKEEARRPETPVKDEKTPDVVPPPHDEEKTVSLPFIGEIDASKLALPVLTFVLAGLDGFNPCAFFVLFMLLSILVYAQSRKKMLLIGGIFVFFSGFIYFLFMSALLNIFLHIGELMAITKIAGIIAVIISLINIKDFFFFKKGISLTIPEKAKPRLFERIRNLLKATSLPSIIIGTIVLAVVANTYEMLCTVGFPMVFTRILTLHNLTTAQYYLYLIAYNAIYVIPLTAIVLIFSISLGAKKLTEWQGQVLKLISGLMMLSLGLVLFLKPALLNNMVASVALMAGSFSVAWVIIFVMKRSSSRPDHR